MLYVVHMLLLFFRYTKPGGVTLIVDGKQFNAGHNFWSSEEHEKTRNELAQKLEGAIQKLLHSSSVSEFKIRMVRCFCFSIYSHRCSPRSRASSFSFFLLLSSSFFFYFSLSFSFSVSVSFFFFFCRLDKSKQGMEHDLGFQMDNCYACDNCHPVHYDSSGPFRCHACCEQFEIDTWSGNIHDMIFVGSSLQKRGGIYRSFGDMVTLCEDCQWDKKFVDAGYEPQYD